MPPQETNNQRASDVGTKGPTQAPNNQTTSYATGQAGQTKGPVVLHYDDPTPSPDLKPGSFGMSEIVKAMRTYESDTAEAMRRNNGSAIKMTLSESMRREGKAVISNKPAPKEKLQNRLVIGNDFTLPRIAVPNMPAPRPSLTSMPSIDSSETLPETIPTTEEQENSLPTPEIPTKTPSYPTDVSNYTEGGASAQMVAPVIEDRDVVQNTETGPSWGGKFMRLVFSLVLIGAGGYGLYYLYTISPLANVSGPNDTTPTKNSIIPTNTQDEILNSSSTPLVISIGTALKKATSDSDIKRISIKDKDQNTLTGNQLIKMLAPSSLDTLNRSVTEDYFIGHIGTQPIFIFKIGYFQNALVAMRSWENGMYTDLMPILKEFNHFSTSSRNNKKELGWSDVLIKNKDAREGKDEVGTTLIVYSFVDKETLIITSSREAFVAVLNRLKELTYTR